MDDVRINIEKQQKEQIKRDTEFKNRKKLAKIEKQKEVQKLQVAALEKKKQTKSLYGAENYLSHRKFQYLCALEAVKNNKMSVNTANKILYQSLRQETKDLFESIRKSKKESSINRQLKEIQRKFYSRRSKKEKVIVDTS